MPVYNEEPKEQELIITVADGTNTLTINQPTADIVISVSNPITSEDATVDSYIMWVDGEEGLNTFVNWVTQAWANGGDFIIHIENPGKIKFSRPGP